MVTHLSPETVSCNYKGLEFQLFFAKEICKRVISKKNKEKIQKAIFIDYTVVTGCEWLGDLYTFPHKCTSWIKRELT